MTHVVVGAPQLTLAKHALPNSARPAARRPLVPAMASRLARLRAEVGGALLVAEGLDFLAGAAGLGPQAELQMLPAVLGVFPGPGGATVSDGMPAAHLISGSRLRARAAPAS